MPRRGGEAQQEGAAVVDHCLELNQGESVDYRIRTSARARNVRLQLSARTA